MAPPMSVLGGGLLHSQVFTRKADLDLSNAVLHVALQCLGVTVFPERRAPSSGVQRRGTAEGQKSGQLASQFSPLSPQVGVYPTLSPMLRSQNTITHSRSHVSCTR